MVVCIPLKIFSPQQLKVNPVGGLIGFSFSFILLQFANNLSGRNAAIAQPG